MSIELNLEYIQKQIAASAERAGRKVEEITLMPVTKTVAVEAIREAITAGFPLIGENKVQEIKQKHEGLSDLAHQVHLIGHLQTNKVKEVIGLVDCVQSVDSLKLAKKLQQRLEFVDATLDILVQVNTSGETSKSGVAPEDAEALIAEITQMERLNLKGLMTIGANTTDREIVRTSFRDLAQIREIVRQRFSDKATFDVLSMGMSGDMDIAIEEGATLIRVGSAIFGARQY